MTIQKIDVCNGKYTVIFDDETGKMTTLRYGEPWNNNNIQGDNLVYYLAMELQEAREELDQIVKVVKRYV